MANPENVSLEANNFFPPAEDGLSWSKPADVNYTFDGGTLGALIENDIPEIASLRAVYSNAVTPLTGDKVAQIDLPFDVDSGTGILFNTPDLRKSGECWFQVPCYFPTGWSFDAVVPAEGDQKMLRILTGRPADNSVGYLDIYLFRNDPTYGYYFRYEGNPVLPNTNFPFGTPADKPTLNEWTQFQVYYKLDNVDDNGESRYYTTFNSASTMYAEFASPVAVVDGNTIRIDFESTSPAALGCLFDGNGTNEIYARVAADGTTWEFAGLRDITIDTLPVEAGDTVPTDARMHILVATIDADGDITHIGANVEETNGFNGILANLIISQGSSLIANCPIDEEYSSSATTINNKVNLAPDLTLVNAAASGDSELVTLPAGDATMRFWIGQTLLHEETARVTLPEAAGYTRQCHLMTFWNGGPTQAQTYYVDSMRYTTITPTNTDSNGYPLLPNVGA